MRRVKSCCVVLREQSKKTFGLPLFLSVGISGRSA